MNFCEIYSCSYFCETNYIFKLSSSQASKCYVTCLLSTSLALIKISKNGTK